MKVLAVSLFTVALLISGCASKPQKSYNTVAHDGRIYVLGSPEAAMKFKETHHMPLTKTMIGAGPNGETVVVEENEEHPEMAKKLWMDYASDNLKYFERFHDGRTYILGSLESVHKFEASKFLPLTKTYIGQGVNGETVVVEESEEDNMLAKSLWAMYSEKHKK